MNEKINVLQKISTFIVKYRWVFVLIFIGLIVFSAFMIPKTEVLYDLSTYAPKGSLTAKSVTLMKEEFDDKGSVNVMFADVTIDGANKIHSDLMAIKGIKSVAFNPQQDYIGSDALFTITLSDYDSTDAANAAIERIIDYTEGKDAYLSGQSTATYYTRKTTEGEIMAIAAIIAVMVLLILLFTSKTYFELVIMIVIFGIAALINFGTNFLLGEISYLSNFIGIILQLVLAIDYSVILLHRFSEERLNYGPKQAAIYALKNGIPEILSSSFTTIAGMCALMFMALPIGLELGLALTKGIVISILTVIFFMPAMLVFCVKPIEKTKHKPFVPNIAKFSRKIVSARYIIVSVFVVITTLACIAQFNNQYSFNINGSKSIVSARERISQNFGTMNTLVVLVPKGDYQKEQEMIDFVMEKPLIDEAISLGTIEIIPNSDIRLIDKLTISEFAEIAQLMDFPANQTLIEMLFRAYINQNDPDNTLPIDEYKIALVDLLEFVYNSGMISDEMALQMEQLVNARTQLESKNYSRIMFNIDGPVEGQATFALIEDLQNELGQFYGENNFYLAGESVINYEMDNAFPSDNLKIILFTTFFIMLILLLTFRNVLLPLLLMLTIQGSIWINFAIPFLMGNSVMFIGYLIITAIQMGATIDYAIILTNRYQALKPNFLDKKEAMAQSINAVFPTIITSGLILTSAGFILGLTTTEPVISSLGMLLGIGTLLSVVMVLFVLPPLLIVCNKLIEKTQLRFRKRKTVNYDK